MSFNNISAVEHADNQRRVHECNVAKGWFDKPVSFLEAMALLVTEVTEAHGAYAEEGLRGGWSAGPKLSSELADVYIRLVDDCSRFGVDLGTVTELYRSVFRHSTGSSFDAVCMRLVNRVSAASEEYRKHGLDETGAVKHPDTAKALAYVYLELEDTCDAYGVDLMQAFEAKLKVNWERPYRHGNKVA